MTSRRSFLGAACAVAVGTRFTAAAEPPVRLKKAVKFGMIRVQGTLLDKLTLLKKLGFDGVEIDAPSKLDLDELNAAQKKTGIIVHGVVDSVHWRDTLSSPKAEIREKGVAALRTALHDAKKVGATTALLVPGVVNAEVSYDQCWERSTAEIKKVLPEAEKTGVKIAIETVWNEFITKPEQLVQYVDQFKSPWIGAYLDPGNMTRYGVSAGDWVKALGKRMLKIDIKGYSKALAKEKGNPGAGFAAKIGDGDEEWSGMVKACAAIGFDGWCTAEVQGGDETWLADVSRRMDQILGLK